MANPRAISWVKRLPTAEIHCRTLRHSWVLDTGFRKLDPEDKTRLSAGVDQVVTRNLTCARCGTHRIDYYGRGDRQFSSFYRLRARYVYPVGYLFHAKEHDEDRPEYSDYLWEESRRVT